MSWALGQVPTCHSFQQECDFLLDTKWMETTRHILEGLIWFDKPRQTNAEIVITMTVTMTTMTMTTMTTRTTTMMMIIITTINTIVMMMMMLVVVVMMRMSLDLFN